MIKELSIRGKKILNIWTTECKDKFRGNDRLKKELGNLGLCDYTKKLRLYSKSDEKLLMSFKQEKA